MGIGGLADGILFHQVLQWHHVTSSVAPPDSIEALRRNRFWDGVFHVATMALVLVGLVLLWGARGDRRVPAGSGAALTGLVLIGWGAFHAVDQLVFHELLKLHNIREDIPNPGLYNWAFFAVGGVLAGLGWLLLRRAPRRQAPNDPRTCAPPPG